MTGGVETEDGRTLYGLDAEVYLRLKNKEDPEWEKQVLDWIETVLQIEFEETDLWVLLKSGVVLCKLINTIKPGIIPKFVNQDKLHVLQERENINLYLDACWRLGIPSNGLFVTSDLHSRRSISGVLTNITALSHIAPRFGYVTTDPIGPTFQPKQKNYKWHVPTNTGPITVADVVYDKPSSLPTTELETLIEKCKTLESMNMNLTRELFVMRENTGVANKLREALSYVTNQLKQSEELRIKLEQHIETLSRSNTHHHKLEKSDSAMKSDKPEVNNLLAHIDRLKTDLQKTTNTLKITEEQLITQKKNLITELEKSRVRLEESQEESRQIMEKLEEAKASESNALMDLNTSTSKILIYEQQLAELEETLATKEDDIELLNDQINTLSEQLQNLNVQYLKAEHEAKQLIYQLESTKALSAKTIESLKHELDQSKLKIAEYDSRMKQLETEVLDSHKKSTESTQLLSLELKDLKTKLLEASAHNAELQTLYNTTKSNTEMMVDNLNTEMNSLREQLADSEIKIDELQTRLVKESNTEEIRILNDKLAQSEAIVKKLTQPQSSRGMSDELTISQIQLQVMEEKHRHLVRTHDQTVHELNLQMTSLKTKLTVTETNSKQVEMQLKSLKTSSSQTISELTDRVNMISLKLKYSEDIIKELNNEIYTTNANYANSLSDIRVRYDNLQSKLDSSQARVSSLENDLAQKSMENENMIMSHNSDILSLKMSHQLELEQLKQKLQAKDAELEKTNSQVSSFTTKYENLNTKLQKEALENQSLKTNLQRTNDKLKKLKKKMKSLVGPEAPSYIPKPPVTEQDEAKLKKILTVVMDPSSDIESESMLEIIPILKTEDGARLFTQMLSQAFLTSGAKPRSYKLIDSAFLRLLFLINTLLSMLDMRNAADYISCKVILQISRIVYHDTDNGKETMEKLLHHHYFVNLEFWEEYFWDIVSRKFQKKFGDVNEDYSRKEKEWLAKKLSTFRNVLQERGLPKETIAELTKKISDAIVLEAPNEKITNRKSQTTLPKFISPPEKRLKSENSLPVFDSKVATEKRKSRIAAKKDYDSVPEIPSVVEESNRRNRNSQKREPKEITSNQSESTLEPLSPNESPSKPRKRLSHFNPDFSSITRLTLKVREDSKQDLPPGPSSSRTSRSSSTSKANPEPIKSARDRAPSQSKERELEREKSHSKRFSRTKSRGRETQVVKENN